MKRILLFLCLGVMSCSGPKSQSENAADSLNADSVSETVSTPTSSYEPPVEETVLGVPVSDLLASMSFPAQTSNDEPSSDSTAYSIASSTVIVGNYTDMTGGCSSSGFKILALQYQPDAITLEGGQETDVGDVVYNNGYNIYSVGKQADSSVAITNTVMGGSSFAHGGTFAASITNAYPLADGCETMVVEYSNEGGNHYPWKKSTLAFYLLDGGEFKEVLSVDLEDSRTFVNFGGGPNNYLEQIYTIDISESKTLGLNDIKVQRQGDDNYEEFVFDGKTYVRKQ